MGIPKEQIAAMLRQAREEALAEAKELIKKTMVHAILKQVLADDCQTQTDNHRPPKTDCPAASMAHRPSSTVNNHRAADSEAHIQEEIAAVRKKIAENEQLLSQIKAPPQAMAETATAASGSPPAIASADEGEGYYVYCIVGNNRHFDGPPQEGVDPVYPVYALPYQGIQAIVSRVSLCEFGQEALKANLNDPSWLEARVRTHQRVLESTLADGALIPMKFCTIYLGEARVQEILAQYHDDFIETLARLDGRQERGVKVFCDREALARWVKGTSEKVKTIQVELTGKSSGMAYFARKKLEVAIAEEIERISDECAQSSHDRLAACAAEACITPLQSQEITGRKEEMVLNGAYLVAEEKVAAFRSEVESLENEYGPLGFNYELTGPWPPYNFVTIAAGEGVADE